MVFSKKSALYIRGQSIAAPTSVLSMTIQGLFPLGLTDLISFLFKGFKRVFSSTTVQKNQLFTTLPSLWSNSQIHTWKKLGFDYIDLCWQSDVSAF